MRPAWVFVASVKVPSVPARSFCAAFCDSSAVRTSWRRVVERCLRGGNLALRLGDAGVCLGARRFEPGRFRPEQFPADLSGLLRLGQPRQFRPARHEGALDFCRRALGGLERTLRLHPPRPRLARRRVLFPQISLADLQQRGDLTLLLGGGLQLLDLRGQTLFRAGEFRLVTPEQPLAFRRAFAVELALALGGAQPVAAGLRGGPGILQTAEHVFLLRARVAERRFALRAVPPRPARGRFANGPVPPPRRCAIVLQAGVKLVPEVRVQQPQVAGQRLVPPRLARLPLERAELPLDLADHVGQAGQVGFGLFEFARGFLALALVFGDARRLLENRAPVLGPGRQDQVDLALLHDGIGRTPDAGIHEKLLDVAQPAQGTVEQVFAAPVAVHAPRNADLVVRRAELRLAIGEGHGHLRHADGLPGVRAVEDHVRHLAAAQGLGRLLAQAPAHGVEHVALAAAVRSHDRRHAVREIQFAFRGERLETVDFQAAQIHRQTRAAANERHSRQDKPPAAKR